MRLFTALTADSLILIVSPTSRRLGLMLAAMAAGGVAAAPVATPPTVPMAVPSAPATAIADPVLLTLDVAVDAAANANIDVATARNAEASAAADVRRANTFPNPAFSVNAAQLRPNRLGGSQAGDYGDSIVRIDQPIERGGKRQSRVAAARAALAAAHGDLADVRRTVRQATSDAFYDLMAAERRQALTRAIADSYARGQTVMALRMKAGDISGGDLARANVDALRAASDAASAEADTRDAQLALGVLIGRESDAPRLATLGDWPTDGGTPAATPAETVADHRPDVVAALARVESARHSLAGAHALRHQDVTVGVQYEHDANALGSTVGVGFSVPLMLGNRYSGDIESADVALRQAQTNADKVRAVAVAEIKAARIAAAAAAARRRQYDDELVPSARHAAQTAEFAYARGSLALLDLLDARRTLQSVELDAIAARSDLAKARSRLIAAETLETE